MDEKRLKKYDEEYVDILLKTIKIKNVRPKYITRTGQSDQKRFRPMKVVFSSKEDKEKVFENIKQIKENSRYEGISITEDFTIKERQLSKEWVEKSKEKNENLSSTSNFKWKVRGTPRTGLYLLKVKCINNILNCKQDRLVDLYLHIWYLIGTSSSTL